MLKKIILFFIFISSIQPIEKSILEIGFQTFQRNPSMKLLLYFHGFGQFDSSSSIFYGKSGPAFAEDIVEDVKITSSYLHMKYTNRGKGEYFNDIFISIPHISLIHLTKSSFEIYVGNPKIMSSGK
jgi:hypothetical protein